jgi:hypothetical protein
VIDELLHSRVQLAIVAILVDCRLRGRAPRDRHDRGQRAVHLRKLADAGYIAGEKSFVVRKPQTRHALTEAAVRLSSTM